MFRKPSLLLLFVLFAIPVVAQTTLLQADVHSQTARRPRPNPAAAVRAKVLNPRPARTPAERLLIPYLKKHVPAKAGMQLSMAQPKAQPSSSTPNFGGYLTAPYYPAHAGNACAIDPGNCGVAAALIADYNKDGNMDVAVPQFDGTLNILLGDGKGGFAAPVVYSNPAFATTELQQSVAVDLNNDGYMDVIAFDGYNNALLVYLNQKNGTFTAPVIIDMTTDYGYINSFAVGDVNGDGNLDVVTIASNIVGQESSDVTTQTYLGNGDGTFQSTAVYTATAVVAAQVQMNANLGITLGDVNGDGHLDVAAEFEEYTSQQTGNLVVTVALGDGTGNFAALNINNPINVPVTSPFNVIVTSSGVQLVDLNGDNHLDVAAETLNTVYVAIGAGNGTFATPVNTPGVAAPNETDQTVFADFNGDGVPDMVIEDGLLNVWLGKGDGTFSVPTAQYIVDGGPFQDLAVYDFNGDGKTDVAQLGGDYKQLSFFSGNGDGTFHGATVLSSTTDSLPSATENTLGTVVDLNGDGNSDVVLIDTSDPSGNIALATGLSDGKGNFTYKSALSPSLLTTLAYIEPIAADFNNDGKQDVVLANIDGTLTVAISNGDGTLKTPVAVPLPALGCEVSYIATADVNGDGNTDIVIPYEGDITCGGAGDTPPGYFVALGNGNGTFATPAFTPYGTQLYSATIADMNGDGKLDLILDDAPFVGGTFSIYLLNGNGDGTFGAGTTVLTNQLISQVSVADYNQDGKPDLILFNEGDQNLQDPYPTAGILLLPGNGDGSFGSGPLLAAGNFFLNGSVLDVNGDGIPDIAAPLWSPAGPPNTYYGFSTLLGTGGGGFAPPVNALQYLDGELPLPGNFFSDNAPDFVVATAAGTALYLGQGGSAISLTASANSVAQGQSVTFTATVAATMSGRPAPTGTVSFFDGSALLGSIALNSGSATFIASALGTGSHSVTAVYAGDGNFNVNTSSAVSVTVTAVNPGITVAANPGALTLSRGQNGTVAITLAANAAYSGTVTLSCSGLPANATCTPTPASISLTAGGTATSTLVIGTTNSAAVKKLEARRGSSPWPRSAGVVSLAALAWAFSRRRRMPVLFSAFLVTTLSLGAVALSGCGGSSSVKSAPTGTYTVTVTATPSSGASAQTATVTVTIQ